MKIIKQPTGGNAIFASGFYGRMYKSVLRTIYKYRVQTKVIKKKKIENNSITQIKKLRKCIVFTRKIIIIMSWQIINERDQKRMDVTAIIDLLA